MLDSPADAVAPPRLPEVEECYDARHLSTATVAGRVVVGFTIGPAGVVSGAGVESSTMHDATLEACLVRGVLRWRFPPPPAGLPYTTRYPFVLAPLPLYILGAPGKPGSVEIQPLDGQLFVHQSRDSRGISSNGLVVYTDGGLLLVDTAWTAEQTEAILRWGEQSLDRPWIGAIITHDHSDRDGGLDALVERRIPADALDLTVDRIAHRGVKRPLTPLLAASQGAVSDPRGFEAFYPGPGHSPDNIVLWFPSSRILFGGCLLKSAEATMLGFTGDADLGGWPLAVRRVWERYPAPASIVPGHGSVDFLGGAYAHTLELLHP